MLPITGKTRRGRPPKFQQYWLALAKQKAEEKLQLSRAGSQENKDKDDLKYGVKFAQKDCSAAELNETRHNPENATVGKLNRTVSSAPNVPLPQNHHRPDWLTSEGDEIQLREERSFNRRFSADDLEERLSAVAKRPRQDLQNSYDVHAPHALCSTWTDGTMVEVIGYDMPLMLTIPSQQPFTHAIQKPVEAKPLASDGRLDLQNVDLMQSSQGISKHNGLINTDERTGLNGDANTLKNWLIDAERCECAIDLSKSKANRQTSEILELNAGIPDTADTGISLPHERIPEDRTPFDATQSWNLGTLLSMAHPWNDQNGLARTSCLASPSQLRPPFPQFSMKRLTRLTEVSMWSADQVARFVSSVPGCQEYAECFRQQDIDGVCLLQLSENHLLNVIRMKLGPSLHLKRALSDLTGVAKNDILK